MEQNVKCILKGIVKKVILEDMKRVYLIYEGHLLYIIALEEEEKYKKMGYDVYPINTQYEIGEMVAEEVLQYCKEQSSQVTTVK